MCKIGKQENMVLVDTIILNGKIENCKTNDDTDYTIGVVTNIYGSTFGGANSLIANSEFPMSQRMEEKIGWRGKFASIKMFTSDKVIDPTKVEEEFIMKYYGAAESEYNLSYSDLTGYLWTDEGFVVGGHDILKLLKSNYGKYIHLEIELYEDKQKG